MLFQMKVRCNKLLQLLTRFASSWKWVVGRMSEGQAANKNFRLAMAVIRYDVFSALTLCLCSKKMLPCVDGCSASFKTCT